ncbi:MAG: hypothetical protein CMI29_03890 [Opitutae bacterium]|nr:hypothetical protein [Opitutae bacterium]
MIFFKDYLPEDANLTAPSPPQSSFAESNPSELIDFPAHETSQECSKEEIGKWVDKLMAMPGEDNSLHVSPALMDDPFLVVASKIWKEELS